MASAMPDDFRVAMMLADSGQAVGGKLYVLGGGWSLTAPGVPGAIAGIISVPWNETNRKHVLAFSLAEADGDAVVVDTPQGKQPLEIRGELEVGRPPGIRPGSLINVPFAVNYPAIPVQAGKAYEWRWSINGKSRDDWRLPFEVRAAVPQPPRT